MFTVRTLACAVAAILVLGAAGEAAAEVAEPISRAREFFRSFEYEDALEVLRGVADDGDASAAQRVQALELTGAIRVLQDDAPGAREAFGLLLGLDPGHTIEDPDIPPRVRTIFDDAHAALDEASAPVLEVQHPDAPAESLDLQVSASGETGGLASVVLFVRREADGSFRTISTTRRGQRFSAELEPLGENEVFQYYVEARAPSGHVLTRLGSADAPRSVEAAVVTSDPEDDEVEPARPWYRRWWVWTIVGAVVVGGGTVTGIVLGTRPEEHEDGSLGSVTMPLGQRP